MRKLILVFMIAVAIAAMSSVFVSKANAENLTNTEFAELLTNALGIEIPAGSEDLPNAEYFEVLSNLLASNNAPYFIGKSADATVNFRDIVTVLYNVVGGPEGANASEKVSYLAENYEIPAYSLNYFPSFAEMAAIFNNPAYASLIAEGYSASEALERGGAQAPGFKLEETPGTTVSTSASAV